MGFSMKSKTIIKILLDMSMTILYLLLMFATGLGGFFHETVGIGIGVLFLIHVVLNWKTVKGLWKTVAAGGASIQKTSLLTLDLLLLICMPVVMVTGILISTVLFTMNAGTSSIALYLIHNAASYVGLGVLGAHMLLHAKYLVAMFKQIIIRWNESSIKKGIRRFAAASLAVGIIYMLLYVNYKDDSSTQAVSIERSLMIQAVDATNDQTEISINTDTSADDTSTSDEDASSAASSGTSDTQNAAVILSDYLSSLYCTACHNHCPLSSPRCGRASQQVVEATADYYAEY